MEYLRQYFKDDLLKGYQLKFGKKFPNNKLVFTSINRDDFSVLNKETELYVQNFSNNSVDCFYFDSPNPDEVFTHYNLKVEGGTLYFVSTIYTYKDDHSIINSLGAKIVPERGVCVNVQVFAPEKTLCYSPMKSLVNILNTQTRILDFKDSGDIIIDSQNPYYSIVKNESNLRDKLNDSKTRNR